MGLVRLYNTNIEAIQAEKQLIKNEYKKIDKKSTKINDLIKRIELLEKSLNLGG